MRAVQRDLVKAEPFGARVQQDLVVALLEEVIGPMYDAVAPYDRGGMYFLAQEMKVGGP